MAALVVDSAAAARAQALVDYAMRHRIGLAVIEKMILGQVSPIGDRPAHVVHFDVGFRAVFDVEQHPQRDGSRRWFRHLSVSVSTGQPGNVPSPKAIEAIMALFGFRGPLDQCEVWIENQCRPRAVNVVELLDGPAGAFDDVMRED